MLSQQTEFEYMYSYMQSILCKITCKLQQYLFCERLTVPSLPAVYTIWSSVVLFYLLHLTPPKQGVLQETCGSTVCILPERLQDCQKELRLFNLQFPCIEFKSLNNRKVLVLTTSQRLAETNYFHPQKNSICHYVSFVPN